MRYSKADIEDLKARGESQKDFFKNTFIDTSDTGTKLVELMDHLESVYKYIDLAKSALLNIKDDEFADTALNMLNEIDE